MRTHKNTDHITIKTADNKKHAINTYKNNKKHAINTYKNPTPKPTGPRSFVRTAHKTVTMMTVLFMLAFVAGGQTVCQVWKD